MQRSSRQSNDEVAPRILPRYRISLRSLQAIDRLLSPIPQTSQRKRHRPRSSANVGNDSLVSQAPASPHLDPVYPLGEPHSPGSSRGCRRRYAASGLGLSSLHRSPWGPLFCGLRALTIDNGCARIDFTPRLLAQKVAQSIMDLGPRAILAPASKVVVDRLVGRKVLRQHTPCHRSS
jgi:hypothetical protein